MSSAVFVQTIESSVIGPVLASLREVGIGDGTPAGKRAGDLIAHTGPRLGATRLAAPAPASRPSPSTPPKAAGPNAGMLMTSLASRHSSTASMQPREASVQAGDRQPRPLRYRAIQSPAGIRSSGRHGSRAAGTADARPPTPTQSGDQGHPCSLRRLTPTSRHSRRPRR
jgi:hypothetical protein